jgi:hypothetical protein
MSTVRWNAKRAQAAIRGGRDTDLDICSDPAFATRCDDPLAEPRVVFQIWRGRQRSECIRLTLSRYKGIGRDACHRAQATAPPSISLEPRNGCKDG